MSKTKTERALLSGTTECTVRGGRGVGGGGDSVQFHTRV